MSFFTRQILCGLLLWWLNSGLVAQAAPGLHFVQNMRQWPAAVQYRAQVPGGSVFLTSAGLVYDWQSAEDLQRAHEAHAAASATHQPVPDVSLRRHAVFVDFVGANSVVPAGQQKAETYHNYFLGNDPSRWAGHVPLFGQVTYAGLYAHTDLRVYGTKTGSLKYDFVVKPGGKTAALGLRYRGANSLRLRPDGTLLVQTSVTDVVEQRPVAYQEINGHHRLVPCRYRLIGNVLGYDFPAGYDASQPLIIDPAVVACSYSGSTASVFGSTTGYDNAGNIYVAGIGQAVGYPVTPGAYQVAFRGANDNSISKLNPAGTQLLYATYLGGTGTETPVALRTNAAGELFVLTLTSSTDFPVSSGCFDPTYNNSNGMAITHFNAAGTALVGSTYLGGTSSDAGADLVLVGADVVVAGHTTSFNFPTTTGAYSRTLSGGQDGFVASLNGSLTTLNWSTFLGGTSTEVISSLCAAANGDVLVAGNTLSPNFPTTPGTFRTTYAAPGDGFITRLRANGTGLVASTFFGLTSFGDNINGLDVDASGNAVFMGNSFSAVTATPGALSVAGGTFFIGKLNAALTAQQFLAVPFSSSGAINTNAFKVDGCGNIHLAGFTSSVLPVVNALPGGTSGGYYTITLSASGTTRLFGSFFGPTVQHAHSEKHRFDEQGNLYQSVCTTSSYPTTVGAYSTTRRTTGFDALMFKINQQSGTGTAVQAAVAAVDSACAPLQVAFTNNTTGSLRYRWNFADGSAIDTTRSPTHLFQNPGTYRVRLVALGSGGTCSRNDTTYVTVRVKAKPTVALPQNLVLCTGGSLTLTAVSPGNTFRWNTGATTASITVTQPGTYRVVVDNGRCTSRDSTVVRPLVVPTVSADTSACTNTGVTLRARSAVGSTYLWSTGATTPTIRANASGRYTVRITQGNCTDEKAVTVDLTRPVDAPNVITPGNADGLNDTFRPTQVVEAGTRLRIYNRWGREVYSTTNYRNDWGAGQPAGVYYYLLENKAFCVPLLKGWLEVVR